MSQTCDALHGDVLQVAPVVTLQGGQAALARKGQRPQFVPLAARGEDKFADLGVVGAVDRAVVAASRRVRGVEEEPTTRFFAKAVSRRFGRFPFPDEVSDWCKPLRDVANKKAGKRSSSEGVMFADVDEIRVESVNGWEKPPYSLRFSFIVSPGSLPTTESAVSEELALAVRRQCSGLRASQIAQRLVDEESLPVRGLLWHELAEAWLALCVESWQSEPVDYEVEVVAADEYRYVQYQESERLDLDHLTGSGS